MKALAGSLVLVLFASTALAKNGAFRSTPHGDPQKGPERQTSVQRGSCVQCHNWRANKGARAGRLENRGLFASNNNELCITCHATPSPSGVFPSAADWQQSAHAMTSAEGNLCIQCHDPHGVRDSAGVIPAMLREREPGLCLRCHDGARGGADIRSEMRKPSIHARDARGTHDPHEGNNRAPQRHATCSDCHNPHRAMQPSAPSPAPEASQRLAGVSRVETTGGVAGMAPLYTWRTAADPATANEYEICFKCHSSWTRQPPGQSDIALETSPASRSFHPIQAVGRNPRIDRNAFVGDWDAQSRVSCTDCHSSDDDRVRGPHGSSYPFLLKKRSPSISDPEPMSRGDLCFDCHSFDVYADASSHATVQRASRFNAPAGHAFHSGTMKVACGVCHETHGSRREEALIATGRFPGISSYTQTAAGGTCNSTCHSTKSYVVSYPR